MNLYLNYHCSEENENTNYFQKFKKSIIISVFGVHDTIPRPRNLKVEIGVIYDLVGPGLGPHRVN